MFVKRSNHIGLKSRAITLRKLGYSYNYIQKETEIPKSTLSGWLQGVAYEPNAYTKGVIGNARAASALTKSKIRMADISIAHMKARTLMGDISPRDLMMIGIGIYIGEGTKSYEQVRVINSDPRIVALTVQWFMKVLSVPLENLYIRLHLYPDSDAKKSILFWSQQTGVLRRNFQKISTDRRINKKVLNYGKLPHGTAHLSVQSHGNKNLGRHLARLIFGMIDVATKIKRD